MTLPVNNVTTLSGFEIPGIRVDVLAQRVFIDNKEISFSALEFKLLSFFVRNSDRVLSRETILNNVWGADVYVTDRVVDSHIRSIRKKLGNYRDHIEAVYGAGYRFTLKPIQASQALSAA